MPFALGFLTALQLVRSASGRRPQPLNHAKLVGTNLTVCGMNAQTWPGLWEHAFPTAPGVQCDVCLAATRRATNPGENS
jgi:hypothetical protein